MSQIHGIKPISRLKDDITYDKRNGYMRIESWAGPYKDLHAIGDAEIQNSKINNPEKPLTSNQVRISQPNTEGFAVLTITYSVDLPRTWTFTSNTITKDLFDHPKFKTIFANYPDPGWVIAIIKGGLKKSINSLVPLSMITDSSKTEYYIEDFATLYNNLLPAEKVIVDSFYQTYGKGVIHYAISQKIFKKSVWLDRLEQYDDHTDKETMLFNKAKLLEYFNDDGSMPLHLQNKLQTTGYYFYNAPDCVQQNNGKLLIEQEFWYASDYETLIYDVVT